MFLNCAARQCFVNCFPGLDDVEKQNYLRSKIESYLKRAEDLKKHVTKEKESGRYEEFIEIEENSINNGFKTLFGRLLDEDVTKISIEDFDMSTEHSLQCFVGFCEVLVKCCTCLNEIKLGTKKSNESEQMTAFKRIKTKLEEYDIVFLVSYSQDVHKREIRSACTTSSVILNRPTFHTYVFSCFLTDSIMVGPSASTKVLVTSNHVRQ